MKVTDKRDLLSPLIQGGDMILLPDGRMFLVMLPLNAPENDNVALIDMETGKFYFPGDSGDYSSCWFNHLQHMRNHLKKHYATYNHIKNKQVEVIIHDKTYSGF